MCEVYIMTEQEWLDIFAGNLQSLMDEYNYNQSELARAIDVDQSTISRYLRAERMPTPRVLVNILYEFDCDLGDILDFGSRIE